MLYACAYIYAHRIQRVNLDPVFPPKRGMRGIYRTYIYYHYLLFQFIIFAFYLILHKTSLKPRQKGRVFDSTPPFYDDHTYFDVIMSINRMHAVKWRGKQHCLVM